MNLKRYIGDRSFYRRILAVAIPMIIQNGITMFVSLLDNIMVGQVGTVQMGGVSIVNQLIFIFNLTVFGISTGAGVFSAQFFGCKDYQGVRYTMRYRLITSVAVSALAIGIFLFADDSLIGLFLTGEGNPADAMQILEYGKDYLYIMLFGLLPFALSSAYAGTLREGGQAVVPMVAGAIAVGVNLVFNYILIFGHLGAPAMGAKGAAIATVISRYVELAVIVCWTHCNPDKNPFVPGLLKSLYIPLSLVKKLILKGIPLMCNEILWSLAVTFMSQCYSTCSLDVVNAVNISSTVNNLFNVVMISIGNTAGILLGHMLGAEQSRDEIRTQSRQMIALSLVTGIFFGGLLASISHVFPQLYNTSDSIRATAASMILITAILKPNLALVHTCYSIIRAGGKTWMTFINDSGFMCCVSAPLAFVLTQFTELPFLAVFFLCQMPEILKMILSFILLRGDAWMQNLTHEA